jgi:hypothetical protein
MDDAERVDHVYTALDGEPIRYLQRDHRVEQACRRLPGRRRVVP